MFVTGKGLWSHVITLNHKQAFALPTSAQFFLVKKDFLVKKSCCGGGWRLLLHEYFNSLCFWAFLNSLFLQDLQSVYCYRHQLSSLQAWTHCLYLPRSSSPLPRRSCRKADFSIIYSNSKIEEYFSKNNDNTDNKYHL